MKAIILNGSQENDKVGERIRQTLEQKLKSRGWDTEHILVHEKQIHNCNGDFFCWIKNPGICKHNDDNRDIARALVHSDLMIYLTPVTFGGYSSALKRFVDHQIQNISPFFARVNGETHHEPRYSKYPDFIAVGWLEKPDPHAEAVFRNLVYRNSLNFYAKKTVSAVVHSNQNEAYIQSSAEQWLEHIGTGLSSLKADLPKINIEPRSRANTQAKTIKNALLLVGSPRNRKSTSKSLGDFFTSELARYGIESEAVYIHTCLKAPEKLEALFKAVKMADLVILAFPLYVDTLPAPVIKALELIATNRKNHTRGKDQIFISIANCGFPESHHNANAQAICKIFSEKAKFKWAGSLSLGGGEMIHGVPLRDLGGRTIPVRKALALAAKAVARGDSIPEEAKKIMAKSVIPNWIYCLFGGFGWKSQARKYGVHKKLKRRAYETVEVKM